jgi:phage protein D
MSDSGLARRVEVRIDIDGTDISVDINKYLLSMSYTDNEEDKTDDLQIELDDREGVWIGDWLN